MFRPIRAVEDVSLKIMPGEAFGFLGHNGAGKTTTIKCIAGLIHTSGGQVLLNGVPLKKPEQRKEIGYLPEHPYFYDHLKVGETLSFLAGLAGISGKQRAKRVKETLEQVGLSERVNAPVRTLSKGLQQRLGLAQAIIHQPSLLLLDEPFSGLDPIGRIEVRELILSLRKKGTTIFVSSHILSDVQDICDRVSIMTQGRLTKVFNLDDTSSLFGQRYVIEVIDLEKDLLADANSIDEKHTASGTIFHAEYQDRTSAEDALKRVVASGATLRSYNHVAPSLEEVFMITTLEAERTGDCELSPSHISSEPENGTPTSTNEVS
ncbi:UNVERIFIED_CONTAM: hypothetical protein GTU68_027036 [Idotea baltica]|nr:hypothetical protein [Idotea baltica]